jgi:hypothetical protein
MRISFVSIKQALAAVAVLAAGFSTLTAKTYEVGPAKAYVSIGSVPWESLVAGDTVLIFWQSTAYKEKWVIGHQGTATAPITVRGVPGPNGELPVIDGNGATTRPQLDFWGQARGVIKVGGSSRPSNNIATHVTIENLEVKSGRPPYSFRSNTGVTTAYATNASAIYIERGEHVTIRNCILHDCGDGFWVSSNDTDASRDILFEGNYVYDNGSPSGLDHNIYTAAIGIVFQYNRLGPLRVGCPGTNLKDRSAGEVVRYNWIEGGNKQLDMVDGADSILIRADPSYRTTHVYGNVFVEPAGDGLPTLFRYGGDMGDTSQYRKGTLHFYNNTIVSLRTDQTILFKLGSADETCEARNNIFYTVGAGTTLFIDESLGTVNLSHNWLKEGFRNFSGSAAGRINNDGTNLTGTEPGFVDQALQNFHLKTNSIGINHGAALADGVLPQHDVVREYVKHQAGTARVDPGTLDIGAYASPQAGGVNLAPQLPAISNCVINEDSSTNISFVITDLDGPGELNVVAASSNPSVIPNSGLSVSGTGTNRTLAISPAANANGSATITVSANDGLSTATRSFALTVNAVNDAPSFVIANTLITVTEDAPTTAISNFVTAISRGPINETNQTISFVVKASTPALFATAPSINSLGTLSFKPALNASGTTLVSVHAQDNGGIANGGKNVSSTNTFQIAVTPVNDLPLFSGVASKTINEDASTNITVGVNDVDGTIVNLTVSSSNEALLPTSSLRPIQNGTNLSITLAPLPNANGSATLTLNATDNQGARTTKTFSVTVRAVNDAPSFTKGPDQIIAMNAGAQSVPGWALPISKGATNESTQAITFTLSNDNTNLFSVQPTISPSTGNLSFTPKSNLVGRASVTVVLRDAGGTSYGGVNAATNKFLISVMRVPMRSGDIIVGSDSPSGTNGNVVLVHPNGTQQIITSTIAHPYAVARMTNGDLIVVDYDATADDPSQRGAVYRIDACTLNRSILAAGGDFAEPCGVVLENDGTLLVADTEAFSNVAMGTAGAIFRISPATGASTVVATDFSILAGVAQTGNALFLTDAGKQSVVSLNPSSGERRVITSGGLLKMPVGIDVDRTSGDLIVADQEAKAVLRVNAVNGAQTIIANGFESPSHVAVAASGDIILSDGRPSRRVYRVNPVNGASIVVTQDGALQEPKGILIIP